MSGLLALLDDVAAITKLAASQLDDISAQALKAGSKAAGVVIDDAAVTPKYVTGLPAARELPIIWKIARASMINKLLILLPAAVLINAFLPWALTPLLMLGGAYLCFEGAEKIWHLFNPPANKTSDVRAVQNAGLLEERRVKGAIKTDFILSAEIMAIALSTIDADAIWQEVIILAVVGVLITIAVYGTVAVLVRADDWGLMMRQSAQFGLTRALGNSIVQTVPYVLKILGAIGTAAMLWVGGNILVHGAANLGWKMPYAWIKSVAVNTSEAVEIAPGFVNWLVVAALDGIVGLVIGLVLVGVISLLPMKNPQASLP